jgi:hypothetical protein
VGWLVGAGRQDNTHLLTGCLPLSSRIHPFPHPPCVCISPRSIFNSNLPEVRDEIVKASMQQDQAGAVREAVAKTAKMLLKKMSAQAAAMGARKEQEGEAKVTRLVDKMLFNYRNIGFIHLIFPRAIILHTVRDPMDTLLSCFTHKFDDKGLEWAFDEQSLVEQFRQYLTIMAHFRKELPGRVIDVNYEDLVRQPEEHVRSLIVDKLGLPWSDR